MTTQAYHTDDDQLVQEHDHSVPENNLTEPDAELAMAEAPPTEPGAELAMADTDLADTDLADTVPAPVALAAYRIVQESLTNVVRHASGAAATVAIRQDGDDLLVEISNDAASGSGESGDGAGAGVAGMRERAAALGGSLAAGPRPGGGFAVRARLPLAGAPQQPAEQEPDRATAGAP
jgi:signal transduction histidine kinase